MRPILLLLMIAVNVVHGQSTNSTTVSATSSTTMSTISSNTFSSTVSPSNVSTTVSTTSNLTTSSSAPSNTTVLSTVPSNSTTSSVSLSTSNLTTTAGSTTSTSAGNTTSSTTTNTTMTTSTAPTTSTTSIVVVPCTCQQNTSSVCFMIVSSNGWQTLTSNSTCTCPAGQSITFSGSTAICAVTTTTTTTTTTSVTSTWLNTTTTTNATTTTESVIDLSNPNCTDINNDGFCDLSLDQEMMRCDLHLLTRSKFTWSKILMYIAAGWVILWCLITIIINIAHKNSGHHRYIQLYEEVGIIILYVCMAILNLTLREKKTACKVISVMNHFWMAFVAAAFFMESIFAHSMVHGKKIKNGIVPVALNYLAPPVIAVIPTLVTYFLEKHEYGTSGIHCFVSVPGNAFWGFVISVWALLVVSGLLASLGNLACNMTIEEQDVKQKFWSKKSCKMLMFFSFWLMMCWLTDMFASSEQRFWVVILFLCQSLVFGPMIFVVHTYCHLNTAEKYQHKMSFYTQCKEEIVRIFITPISAFDLPYFLRALTTPAAPMPLPPYPYDERRKWRHDRKQWKRNHRRRRAQSEFGWKEPRIHTGASNPPPSITEIYD